MNEGEKVKKGCPTCASQMARGDCLVNFVDCGGWNDFALWRPVPAAQEDEGEKVCVPPYGEAGDSKLVAGPATTIWGQKMIAEIASLQAALAEKDAILYGVEEGSAAWENKAKDAERRIVLIKHNRNELFDETLVKEKRIQELEGQLQDILGQQDDFGAAVVEVLAPAKAQKIVSEHVNLKARLQKAEKVVRGYAQHLPGCPYAGQERTKYRSAKCDCGYEAALADYDKEKK